MTINVKTNPTQKDLIEALKYINSGIDNGSFNYLGTNMQYSIDIACKWYQSIKAGNPHVIAIYNDSVVGLAHIDIEHGRRSVNGYLAITVKPTLWGKGIGKMLITTIEKEVSKRGLIRITAEPCVDNKRAISFLTSIGYVKEGLLKKAFRSDQGELIDRLILGKIL